MFPFLIKQNVVHMNNQNNVNLVIKNIVNEFNSPNIYYLDIGRFMLDIPSFPYYNDVLMYKDDMYLNGYGSGNIAKLYVDNI